MIKIDETKLKEYLEKNKSKIGFQKINLLPVIISFLSTLVTFLCKDNYPFEFVKIIMIIVVVSSFIYTVWMVITNILSKYNYNFLYYDIETLDDEKAHFFNIVIQKYNDKTGKILTFYSDSWKCRLVPNYKSLHRYKDSEQPKPDEIENICKLFKKDTGISVSSKNIQYMGLIHDTKYSQNDKVNKQYIFRFFLINKDVPDTYDENKFEYGGKRYYWMTIPEMYKDKKIIKNDKNVVEKIKALTTIC